MGQWEEVDSCQVAALRRNKTNLRILGSWFRASLSVHIYTRNAQKDVTLVS
jgi:hypothetical protein